MGLRPHQNKRRDMRLCLFLATILDAFTHKALSVLSLNSLASFFTDQNRASFFFDWRM
jgi:hypothetical protein